MTRWGDPDRQGFGPRGFGATLADEATFGGFTIPRRITAGWHAGSDRSDEGRFIDYTIDDARHR